MSEKNIVVRKLGDTEGDRTDWERLDALTDKEIEQAVATDPDAELLDEEWFRTAELIVPSTENERVNLDDFFEALREELVEFAATELGKAHDKAIQDAEQFLENSEDDLKRWTRLLSEGELTKEEFESLVHGQIDLAKMKAPKQAGLTRLEIDRFRNEFLNRIADMASRAVL